MEIMATVPARTGRSTAIRQPRAVRYSIAARRSPLKGFRQFIESADWEERYLCNRWIDRMCLAGLVASFVYFTPLLITIVQAY